MHLLTSLFMPSLKFRKTPSSHDIEVIDLFWKKTKAVSIIDPYQFVLDYLIMVKRVIDFDLTNFKLGLEIFTGTSSLFSFSGISFDSTRMRCR